MGHEALGGQRGPSEIAAGEAGTADAELARDADRHRLPSGRAPTPQVGDRPSDRAALSREVRVAVNGRIVTCTVVSVMPYMLTSRG